MRKKQVEDYPYEKWIITETNKPKQIWDFYCLGLVIYVSLVVPYRLGLDLEDSTVVKTIGYIIDLSFLADMILTFFSESFDA